MDFRFHQMYGLDDYNDNDSPSVFFGIYRYEDKRIAFDHHAKSLLFWTGQDALDFDEWEYVADMDYKMNSVTAHPKVYNLIKSKGCECKLIKPGARDKVDPQKLGKRIYAYCPASAPEYHGSKIIQQLRDAGYDIIVGDGTHSQVNWRAGLGNDYYGQAFIGLCLSEFAGGGGSIIDMGLRGMKVVTNVFDLPNCVPWGSVEDIMLAIEEETKNIGTVNCTLAEKVWNDLDSQQDWLYI